MNEKKILALGFFDGVHLGHQALLKACRCLADETGLTAAAVTFDRHPMSLTKGRSPLLINTPFDREALLTEQGMDEIITLPFDEQLRGLSWQDFLTMLIREYNAAGFVCGSDYRFGYKGEGTALMLQQAAKARENNPEATLTELAEMMEPAITKPAMNNRMKRLVQLAKEYRQ